MSDETPKGDITETGTPEIESTLAPAVETRAEAANTAAVAAGTRSGFVSLLGAPNAGKSTLVNKLVGTKVSIVTHKVQTTRALVRGIAIEDRTQIVFVDTPGVFAPKRRLDRAMVKTAWTGARDADVRHDVRPAPAAPGSADAEPRQRPAEDDLPAQLRAGPARLRAGHDHLPARLGQRVHR